MTIIEKNQKIVIFSMTFGHLHSLARKQPMPKGAAKEENVLLTSQAEYGT